MYVLNSKCSEPLRVRLGKCFPFTSECRKQNAQVKRGSARLRFEAYIARPPSPIYVGTWELTVLVPIKQWLIPVYTGTNSAHSITPSQIPSRWSYQIECSQLYHWAIGSALKPGNMSFLNHNPLRASQSLRNMLYRASHQDSAQCLLWTLFHL